MITPENFSTISGAMCLWESVIDDKNSAGLYVTADLLESWGYSETRDQIARLAPEILAQFDSHMPEYGQAHWSFDYDFCPWAIAQLEVVDSTIVLPADFSARLSQWVADNA